MKRSKVEEAKQRAALRSLPSIRKRDVPQATKTSSQNSMPVPSQEMEPASSQQSQQQTSSRGRRIVPRTQIIEPPSTPKPHAQRRKPNPTPKPHSQQRKPTPTPTPSHEYVIDRIVERRWNQLTDDFEWRTKWSKGDETWEPRTNFVDELSDGNIVINDKWQEFENQHQVDKSAIQGNIGVGEQNILADPTAWMNDEVLNSYFDILRWRFPRHFFASSYFYNTIIKAKEEGKEVQWYKVCSLIIGE